MNAEMQMVNSTLDMLQRQVAKLKEQEIPSSWKEELLRKVHEVKMDLRRIKTRPRVEPSLPSCPFTVKGEIGESFTYMPEVNPLRNSLVVKTVLDHLEPSSSFSAFKSLRSVSKEFKDLITPKLIRRSNLFNMFSIKNESTIKEWDKLSLVLDYSQLTEDEALRNLLKKHGHKIIGVNITLKKGEGGLKGSLYPLLQKMFPNLEELNLLEKTKKEETQNADSVTSIPGQMASSSSTSKMKIKNLKVVISYKSEHRDIISTTIDCLLRSEHLRSLTFAGEPLLGRDVWTSFFSTTVSKSSEIFKNIERLELLNFNPDAVEGDVLNRIELPNLRDLRMQLRRNSRFIPFLEIVKKTLEKLEVLLVDVEPRGSGITYNFPQMPNLLVFVYSYAKFFNDYHNYTRYDPQEYRPPLVLNARNIINSMSELKHWKAAQSTWVLSFGEHTWEREMWCTQDRRESNYFSDRNCKTGLCTHIQQLLETEDDAVAMDEVPFHGNLEKLDFSCSFREPRLISRMSSTFRNIADLSLWIQSDFLNDYFTELASLEKLKVLKVALSSDVKDFPKAVNSNLPKLKNLKELLLQNGSNRVPRSEVRLEDHYIFHIDKAHPGFIECFSLKILSFKDMKINARELKTFQIKLLKSKPDLAVNVVSNCRPVLTISVVSN